MKSFKIIFIVLLSFTLVACAPKPVASQTVHQFMIAYKSQNQASLDLLTTKPLILYQTDISDDKPLTKLANKVYKHMLEFDYEVVSEDEDGDEASINVRLTSYNYIQVVKQGVEEANEAIKEKIDQEDFDLDEAYVEAFKYIDVAQKDYMSTIELKLRLVDNNWLITNAEALEYALMKNYSEAVELVTFDFTEEE